MRTLLVDSSFDVQQNTQNAHFPEVAPRVTDQVRVPRAHLVDLALRGDTGYDDLQARNRALTIDFTWY